jgi:hypothetical protein
MDSEDSVSPNVLALCENCQKYPRPTGTDCRACLAIANSKKLPSPPPPPPGYEHTVVDQTPCNRCEHFKGDHWGRCRVSRPTGMTGEAAWVMCECTAFVDAARTEHPNHGVVDFGGAPNLEALSPDPVGGGSS